MPDYLEEALDNTRALLEQVRRLERKLSGAAAEEMPPIPTVRGERARAGEPQAGDGVSQKENGLDGGHDRLSDEERRSRRKVEAALKREDREPESVRRREAVSAEKREDSALLEELDRLDWAVRLSPAAGYGGSRKRQTTFQPGESALPRSKPVFPETVDLAGESWGVGDVAPKSVARTEEALRWAERADRVFRRDSRRYDGGFYLY